MQNSLNRKSEKGFMNIQLFAEPAPTSEPITTPTTVVETQPTSQPEAKKTVDKDLFDKTASELAAIKKWQKERMTVEELSQAEAQAKQTELENLKAEIKKQKLVANQNLAMGLTAEVKSLAGIEESDMDYSEFINSLSSHDTDSTTKLATMFSKIAKKAYEKGANDKARGAIQNLANNVSIGGGTGSSGFSEGKAAAERFNRNNLGTTDIFTKINK